MGLIQRAVESAGISSVSITLSPEITRKVRPPRALYTDHPLGHPLGFPNQTIRQLRVLRLMLKALEEIDVPGTIIMHDLRDSDDPKVTFPIYGS